jgi:hypothetical protein
MRTKTIIDGFKNSQRFRFILMAESGEEVGMVITVKQMSDQFATRNARMSVWNALIRLAIDRRIAERKGDPVPTGLVTSAFGFRQVQVDLH